MKMVFTTSEVAEACGVSYQTIYRRINQGALKSYRIPGSNHRRVTRRDLLEFIKQYGYPMRPETSEQARVLAIVEEESVRRVVEQVFKGKRWFEFQSVTGAVAGVLPVLGWIPDIMILDSRSTGAAGSNLALEVLQDPALADCKIIHIVGPRDRGLPAGRRGREVTLRAPGNPDRLLELACKRLGWFAPVTDRDYIREQAPHWDPREDARLRPGPGQISPFSGQGRKWTSQE